MTSKIVTTLFLILFQLFVYGQTILSGTIIDKSRHLPIEYANIGILEKGVGTVCNSLGEFNLIIPEDLLNNYLAIDHIGYENTTIKIIKLISQSTELKIELNPSSITLKEVTILASQQVNLGYKPNGDQVKGFFQSDGLGLEGGTLIQNNGKVQLTKFNFNILKIPFESLKFRLNIYSLKKNNPSTKVNTRDVIFTISKADTGLYSLPLVNENIQVKDNFICTIELIELFGQSAENAEFLFSAIPNKDGFIYKKTISLGRWEKIKKFSLCFWLTGEK